MFWSTLLFIKKGKLCLQELSYIIVYPDKYFWFLYVLFFICMLFTLVKWIVERMNMNETLLLVCLGGLLMVIMIIAEFRYFGFQFISYYYIFYCMGYLLHRYPQILPNHRQYIIIGIVFVSWLILAWFWNMHQLPGWIPSTTYIPTSLMLYVYRGITATLAILLLLSLSPVWLSQEAHLNRIIAEFGRISLGIYVVHLLIMGHIVSLIRQVTPITSYAITESAATVCAVLVSYSVVMVIQKSKLASSLLLGKTHTK